MHRFRTTSAAVAIAASGALLLAACGDDGDSGTTAATPAPTTAASSATTMAMASETIVDIAAGNEDFSTLVSAVQAAGLGETLAGDGPFTVFAPTDEAFAAVPKAALDALLEPANKETLTRILTYHVVAGEVMAADVQPGAVTTVEGSDFTVSREDGGLVITDGAGGRARIVDTDIVGSNGVIHVIDAVLIPSGVSLPS
jgi:uncharacterized surface protein with fasciclin (FAS1) repeats